MPRTINQYLSASFYFLTLAMAFFIPLPSKATNVITIGILLVSVISFFYHKKLHSVSKFFFLIAPYLLALIGMLYTSNFKEGFFLLEKQSSLLIFPLCYAVTGFEFKKEQIDKIFLFFSWGAILAFIFCVLKVTYNAVETGSFSLKAYTSHEMASTIGLHASYLAICLVQSFLYYLEKVFQHPKKWFIYLILIVILLGIGLLAARIAFLGLLFGAVTGIVFLGIRYGRKRFSFMLILAFGILTIAAIATNKTLLEKLKEMVNYNNEYTLDKIWGGRSVRLLKWDCSFDIIESSFPFGVGTGDAQDHLQACYTKKNYTPLLFWPDRKFNAHNEFLQISINFGALGFAALVSILVWATITLVKLQSFNFASFLFLFTILSLVESTLEVNKGIIYFGFFISLLAKVQANQASSTS